MSLIIFPDPEDLAGTYLLNGLAAAGVPVPVSTLTTFDKSRATPAHTPHVRIEVIGGQRAGEVTEDVTLLIEAYADDAPAAIRLAGLCRALMHDAPRVDGLPIYAASEYTRPHKLPDPRTGLCRYTQTVGFRMRGAAA